GVSGDYALSVLALDGKSLVRVSLRKTNESIHDIGLEFRAGVVQVLNIPIPAFGQGGLPAIAHGATTGACTGLMSSFGAAVARINTGFTDRHDTICCYDLDLSKESAQGAFLHLLKLNPSGADLLHEQEDSGITKVTLQENEEKTYRNSNFKALEQQIWGKEKLDVNRDGMLTKANKSTILYYDQIHKEISNNLFTGRREVEWEGITVKDNRGLFHNYYRFCYKRQHKLPQQSYVDHHFSLAKYLGIESVCEVKSQLIEMSNIKKLFSTDDDIAASIELYFTDEGVERIQKADALTGQIAFQQANSDTPREADELAKTNAVLAQYQELAASRWSIFGKSEPMEALIENYQSQFDRDFETDLALFKKAQEFGKFIAPFTEASDEEHARALFAMMGSSSFDYWEALKALTHLAGRSHLKVHQLTLSGGEVSIKSVDEGKILHPRTGINLLPGATIEAKVIAYG
ncbi:MAG TPA: hypothetical protein VEK06_01720, partial [Myxococcota bacterium]|nr:hypothetical protein [Myxococcota bacterium]